MRFAIIGRSEILFNTAQELLARGHELTCVVTAKEASEYTVKREDFEALAKAHNAPFISSANIEKVRGFLKDMPPAEIAVSVNYSGIIPQDVIDVFPLGILNAHGGDLPRYRGNACQAWALINGEERIGLCVHSMIGGELDNGDIISREYLDVDINTKIGTVWDWMRDRTPSLFADAIDALAQDPAFVLETQSKEPADALRCYPRRPEDGRIDWKKTAEDILRLINACGSPYAGAFCYLGGETDPTIIHDAELLHDAEVFVGVPGQVAAIGQDCIDVITGNGKLRITRVEREGEQLSPSQCIGSIRERLR